MATIQRFEYLRIWQDARRLCLFVHELTGKTEFAKDFDLVRQINRSSGSALDNIAEGFERRGNKEFAYFLSITKGSLGEVRSQLYRASDKKYISDAELKGGIDQCLNLSKQASGFMSYISKTHEGSQVQEPLEKYDF